jgi:2-succinyl-5-enolpyruvyl-6-hydroxy-3-cyclohexene-1-carboxylate synthase
VASDYVHADVAETLRALAADLESPVDAGWAETWGEASRATRATLLEDAAGPPHEGHVLAGVARTVPAGGTLFVSSSMPVRDLDAFGAPREEPLRVHGNRGASGIDGVVSTAFGVSATTAGPVVCVLGDVALFHDQNGLLWRREEDASVVFVLVDNDGGGIFHMLPVREHEPFFTPYFATPHGLDFAHAAALHDIPLVDADPAGLPDALAGALAGGGTRIVRVRTEREHNRLRHVEVVEAVTRSVRATLG